MKRVRLGCSGWNYDDWRGRFSAQREPRRRWLDLYRVKFDPLEATASWRYVRFHYGARGRGGNYSATELEHWARRIAAWRRSHEVYAYFNNDWRGYAPANALTLKRHLSPTRG